VGPQVVLTHIDSDHIGGLIKFVKNAHFDPSQVGKYWFNSKNIKFILGGDNISYGQAISFEELLIEKGEIANKWSEDIYVGSIPATPKGIDIEILSPTSEVLHELNKSWPELSEEYKTKLSEIAIASFNPSQMHRGKLEDLALANDIPEKTILGDLFNSSSIAFVLRSSDFSMLFLGDSHPYLIKATMEAAGYSIKNKLKVDIVKVSHHGSKNNTVNYVLDMIDSNRFIISTNGGNSNHSHPDRETIARIVHHPERVRENYPVQRKIYLNYPLASVESKSGKFTAEQDFVNGNWLLVDDANLFEQYE
jgi:hypothetical protein